jgi:hypothetical protein
MRKTISLLLLLITIVAVSASAEISSIDITIFGMD